MRKDDDREETAIIIIIIAVILIPFINNSPQKPSERKRDKNNFKYLTYKELIQIGIMVIGIFLAAIGTGITAGIAINTFINEEVRSKKIEQPQNELKLDDNETRQEEQPYDLNIEPEKQNQKNVDDKKMTSPASTLKELEKDWGPLSFEKKQFKNVHPLADPKLHKFKQRLSYPFRPQSSQEKVHRLMQRISDGEFNFQLEDTLYGCAFRKHTKIEKAREDAISNLRIAIEDYLYHNKKDVKDLSFTGEEVMKYCLLEEVYGKNYYYAFVSISVPQLEEIINSVIETQIQ